jgi:hypothetical protein
VTPAARSKCVTRPFLLRDVRVRDTLVSAINNLPLDNEHPIEVVIREPVKARKPDQNSAYWAGPLRDIAEQAYVEGRRYSSDVFHEFFKREFLPEEYNEEDCREGYVKWDYTPGGERVLVGSTKSLTVKGMAKYITQVEAYGASLGVMFRANPNDSRYQR